MSTWIQEVYDWLENNNLHFQKESLILEEQVFSVISFPEKKMKVILFDLKAWVHQKLSLEYGHAISELSSSSGFKYIILWQDLWVLKQALIKARISSLLGFFQRIHARHCLVQRIEKPIMDSFLHQHHLQESTQAKVKYGLFLKKQYIQKYLGTTSEPTHDALVAVASFSGARKMKWGNRQNYLSYELLRFASLQGYVVVGGMDKLIQAFAKEYQPDDLMSYADKDWSDGRSYEVLGFDLVANLTLGAVYWINPLTFERHFENRLLQQLTSEQLINRGWVRIWNSGSLKYIKTLKKD